MFSKKKQYSHPLWLSETKNTAALTGTITASRIHYFQNFTIIHFACKYQKHATI